MHRELLEYYNRELALFYEQAKEFAEEYPGIADRLGGLTRDRADPMVVGLLEGAALLAARVQLKLKHEFSEFTGNLIEQLFPNYLAPIPSVMLAQVNPTFGDPALKEGSHIARDATLDAVYRDKDQNVSCTFALCRAIDYWPLDIARAEYSSSISSVQALGVEAAKDAVAGLRLTLRLRTAVRLEDENPVDKGTPAPEDQFAGCLIDDLSFHLIGSEADAVTIYEQIFASLNGLHIRYLDEFGDPQVLGLPLSSMEQIGFGDEEALFPYDRRIFRGFDLLQEYFVFPQKFLGFKISGLQPIVGKLRAKTIDIVMTFKQSVPRLNTAVTPSMFSIFSAPAVNLFPKAMDRIQLRSNQHEYQVVPDRTQYVSYEPHRLTEVFVHYPGRSEKKRLSPLYQTSIDQAAGDNLNYSVRRLPRKQATEERDFSVGRDYAGTDMFVSVSAALMNESPKDGLELGLRAMCSNRHLAEQLPIGSSGADFIFRDDTSLNVTAVVPPTAPREALIAQKHDADAPDGMGPTAWRLVNLLSLNHLGLLEHDGWALREILSMFSNLGDGVAERRVKGIRGIKSRPVIRRLQQRLGVGAARGLEITVTIEEKAFEGSGIFLLGAVLDRFFAEYAAINHFTSTVIRSVERGEIARWPARSGNRRAL